MAPMETERKQEIPNQGLLCCACPALPTLLPKLAHLKELEGCLCTLTHLHSLLSNALDHCKHTFLCTLHEALGKNPHLSRLLPPQPRASRPPQMRGHARRRHALASYNFAAVLPGDSVAAIVVSNGLVNFLNIYNTLLVVRLILTWFPEPPQVIVNPLSTICDPYLNIFRGIIPPLGGTIDLSPILAFLVLNVFSSSAAALPAELPAASQQAGPSLADRQLSSSVALTQIQKAWLRRQVASSEAKKVPM